MHIPLYFYKYYKSIILNTINDNKYKQKQLAVQ